MPAGSFTESAARQVRSARGRPASGKALTANRSRLDTPSGVCRRKAWTPCGASAASVTTAVSSYFLALSSIGASVRTTPFAISGFSIGTSLIAEIVAERPGSLKMIRVAPAMFDPWIVERGASAALCAGGAHSLQCGRRRLADSRRRSGEDRDSQRDAWERICIARPNSFRQRGTTNCSPDPSRATG